MSYGTRQTCVGGVCVWRAHVSRRLYARDMPQFLLDRGVLAACCGCQSLLGWVWGCICAGEHVYVCARLPLCGSPFLRVALLVAVAFILKISFVPCFVEARGGAVCALPSCAIRMPDHSLGARIGELRSSNQSASITAHAP
jgi:hypothetical protein